MNSLHGPHQLQITDPTDDDLRSELAAVTAELCARDRKFEALLADQARWERRARATIRRTLIDFDRTERIHYGLGIYLDQAVQPVSGLIYRIDNLPDRPKPTVIAELKTSATDARRLLADSKRRLADADGLALIERLKAEVDRLRDLIVASGKVLHAQHGGAARPCTCAGCELIISMDDVPLAESAALEAS